MKFSAAALIGLALFAFSNVRAQQAADPAQPSRSVWEGVYTEKQAKRGHALYESNCATCHGPTLNGIDVAPPLSGTEFINAWNGLTVGDLFERVRLSMPPDEPGKLGRQEKADIVAFVLSFSKYSAGNVELPHETEVLKQIRIEPKPE